MLAKFHNNWIESFEKEDWIKLFKRAHPKPEIIFKTHYIFRKIYLIQHNIFPEATDLHKMVHPLLIKQAQPPKRCLSIKIKKHCYKT